jgi:hypothetical protein
MRASTADRYRDSATQSRLNNAVTAEIVFWMDNGRVTDDPKDLNTFAPDLQFREGDLPEDPDYVYVYIEEHRALLSMRSRSGTCFYLSFDPPPGAAWCDCAMNAGGGRARDQVYSGRIWKPPLSEWQRFPTSSRSSARTIEK